MSTNNYKWLPVCLAAIVVSGCSVGSRPNLNLGIADAFRKSKDALLRKKLSYQAPTPNTNFGYAPLANHGAPVSLPSHDGLVTLSDETVIIDQTAPGASGGCNCNSGFSAPVEEFYMPVPATEELVAPPASPVITNALPTAALPFEESQTTSELENPLPAPIDVPSTPVAPAIDIDPTEEEGIIESLDSASIDDTDEVLEKMEEDFEITPKKDESSILDTAAKQLEAKAPTSAGESVVEQRSKMLTLTARPVQSHRASATRPLQRNKVEMQQVTHKRHFRQQNALRPLHQKFRSEPLERTAEAPGPVKFKPLPVLSKESPQGKSSDTSTGSPALNKSPSSETLKQSSTKMQRLPSPSQKLESETEQESVIKIARLPILKAESTSSAAIGSLRNFTNVRDHDPGFDKEYYSRLKEAEAAAAKAAQVIADNVSDADEDLSIER